MPCRSTFLAAAPPCLLSVLNLARHRVPKLTLLRWSGAPLVRLRSRPAELRSALPMLYYGLGLRTPRGSVHKGDVMMYWQGPTLRAAFMLGAFRAVQAPPHDETFLVMHPLAPTEDARRFKLEGRVGDVARPLAWVHFAAAVCWYPLDDGLIHCVRGTDFD